MSARIQKSKFDHDSAFCRIRKLLSALPQSIPKSWSKYVNEPASEAELAALRRSVARGTPYGSTTWVESTVRKLGLESTFRKPGRPTKR